MTTIILTLIFLASALFTVSFLKDFIRHKHEIIENQYQNIILTITSPIIFLLSTFGVSDFAISTVLYRKLKLVKDSLLPGTLNTQCVIPLLIQAFVFIAVVKISALTLSVCLAAQVLGAYLGPRLVVKLSERTIRLCISVGLILASILILASKLHLLPSGGTATSLSGYKLVIAAICLFSFGALNNIGIGAFAPTMVTVYALGLNPIVAFPIMMGASALSIPIASLQFIKFNRYNRKITFFTSTVGLIGVFFGVYLIEGLDLSTMQWVVSGILLYSGFSMLLSEIARGNYVENNL